MKLPNGWKLLSFMGSYYVVDEAKGIVYSSASTREGAIRNAHEGKTPDTEQPKVRIPSMRR